MGEDKITTEMHHPLEANCSRAGIPDVCTEKGKAKQLLAIDNDGRVDIPMENQGAGSAGQRNPSEILPASASVKVSRNYIVRIE